MEIENDFINLIKPLTISLKKIDEIANLKLSQTKVEELVEKKTSRAKLSTSRRNSKEFDHYLCSFPGCSKLFGKHSRLIVHERTHTGERPFRCSYKNCNRSYTRRFHLVRHVSVSHGVSQVSKEDISCDKCEKKFSNVYSLKKHEDRYHGVQKRYPCQECGQIFRKQQHLKTHCFVHTGIKPYKCEFPECENRYDIPSRLKRHSQSHVEGRYRCTYDNCTENPKTYTELRRHLTEAHPKVCDVCGSVYETFSHLKNHLLTHEAIREVYYCPYTPCERYYCYEKNLHSHIRSKHNKNSKGFECPICSKWLVTRPNLKRHLTTHDLNKPEKKIKSSRKPRKDKGVSRTDFAKLLSGYSSGEEEASEPQIENESFSTESKL